MASYMICYWDAIDTLTGEFGKRRSKIVNFISPRKADINHVVGVRGVEEPAFIQHFAGPGKQYHDIIGWFFSTPSERKVTHNMHLLKTSERWKRLDEATPVPSRYKKIDFFKDECVGIVHWVQNISQNFKCLMNNTGVEDPEDYCPGGLFIC